MKRIIFFIRGIRALGRIAWTRHNLRALWLQSDPDWLAKMPLIKMSDEEFDAFMDALDHDC